jgi:hypothetical protein
MIMRPIAFFILFMACRVIYSQAPTDSWICAQLGKIVWNQTYEGVLADYHPVTITLASDNKLIAGYLVHKGDNRTHRLMGDWTKKDLFQLQERDEYDRLTGYLRGSITGDQLRMEWMSSDQTRMFDIIAYPSNLIKIRNFKPVAEWIEIDADTDISISVQKMDYGIVSGLAKRNGQYSRFEGYCLDGTCSIWNTVIQNDKGAPIRVQMRQRDALGYRAILDGKEFPATISTTIPLAIRKFDNSMGFLDFVYPMLQSKTYDAWLGRWIDKLWSDGITHLTAINQPGTSGRLVHRSSGWIEILGYNDQYISGMITYINPGSTRRESFIWLKREDIFLTAEEILNTPADFEKAASLALKRSGKSEDEEYMSWLRGAGFSYLLPSADGIVMLTEFNMIYGDDIQQLTLEDSKALIKKKYWKYFGW